jgi:hypothetical protein
MNYHGQIMNIPIKIGKQITALNESIPNEHIDIRDAAIKAYTRGHRDARHDAAEIVLTDPDQSDKEIFDAQMISTLKDRVKGLEDACLGCMKWFNRSFTIPKNLDSWYYKMEALLPKEKQDDTA